MVLPDRTCYEFVNFTPDLLKIAKITSLLPPLSHVFGFCTSPDFIPIFRELHTCFLFEQLGNAYSELLLILQQSLTKIETES